VALTAGLIIAGRYALQEQLGVGAMGEVWRAQDTRFETRSVAVKFLREDEVLNEDAQNRERLLIVLRQQAARGPLTAAVVYDALGTALVNSNPDALKHRIAARFDDGSIEIDAAIALFDELAADPVFNENARMRAKLRRLFRDEANAVANLRHENIVSIFDYGDHDGSPYLVMDYIEGQTLQQIVQRQEPLPLVRRLRLMEDLCAGLGYAHKRKLVHRDIKPANLIIDSGTQRLKILDFGVVRRLGTESTVGIPIGTFCYMSPEQTRGAATLDHRSDIFAVGVVFYELLSGKKAFPPGRGVGDLIIRIQRSAPTPLKQLVPGIGQPIQDIIDRAIEKQPEQRYQDLDLVAHDIARVRVRIEAEETSLRRSLSASDATVLLPQAGDRPRARDSQPTDLPASAPAPVTPPVSPVVGGGETIQMKVPSLRLPTNVLNRRGPEPTSSPFKPPPPEPPPNVRTSVAPSPPPPPKPSEPERPLPAAAAPVVPSPLPLPTTTPGVPAGVERKPRNPLVLIALVAAAALIAVVVAVVWRRGPEPTPAAPAAIESVAAPTPNVAAPPNPANVTAAAPEPTPAPEITPVIPPASASLRSVVIDIRPWARVRIVPAAAAEGQPLPKVPAAALFAPFTVDLAPGDYVLECENDGLSRAAKFPLKVDAAEGRAQFFTRNMPGFDPAGIVDALLRQD
jgi:serine/threonine-protein kinase